MNIKNLTDLEQNRYFQAKRDIETCSYDISECEKRFPKRSFSKLRLINMLLVTIGNLKKLVKELEEKSLVPPTAEAKLPPSDNPKIVE